MKPICSVVMPLRRLDAYAEAAIDSIVGQTLRNIELVLVVHQGSVDVRAQIADFAGSATRCVVVDSQSEKLSDVRNGATYPNRWFSTGSMMIPRVCRTDTGDFRRSRVCDWRR